MVEAGLSSPELRRILCALKIMAIIPQVITSVGFTCLILQPDWWWYNNYITFGVLGGPFCKFKDTENVKKCHKELKDFYHLDFGIPVLLWLFIPPPVFLFSGILIIMSFWFGYRPLFVSGYIQLVFSLWSVIGEVLFMLQLDVSARRFSQPNETAFQMKDHFFGPNMYIYFVLAFLIIFSSIATFVAGLIEYEVEIAKEEDAEPRDREQERIDMLNIKRMMKEMKEYSEEGPRKQAAREYLARMQALKPPPSLKKKRTL